MPTEQSERMLDVLKRCAAVLRDREIPYALGGGLALWAVGSGATDHDIDFLLPDREASQAAQQALADAGMRPEDPPEGWLLKVWCDGVLVDLVHEPMGIDPAAAVARAVTRNVYAMALPVMRPEDVFLSKLAAMSDHYIPFEPLLEHARSLREQINWDEVRRASSDSPFARAFFTLLEGLGVLPPAARPHPTGGGAAGPHASGPSGYLAAHLEEALAEDGRVAEPGLHVEVSPQDVVVRGWVSDEDRHRGIAEVMGNMAGDRRVLDLTEVPAGMDPVVDDV